MIEHRYWKKNYDAYNGPIDLDLIVYPSSIGGHPVIMIDCPKCGIQTTYATSAMSLGLFNNWLENRRCHNVECPTNREYTEVPDDDPNY